MKTYTTQEIEKALDEVAAMDRYTMAKLWRFTEGESIYFRSDYPVAEVFKNKFFGQLGGFSPEISKSLGWN